MRSFSVLLATGSSAPFVAVNFVLRIQPVDAPCCLSYKQPEIVLNMGVEMKKFELQKKQISTWQKDEAGATPSVRAGLGREDGACRLATCLWPCYLLPGRIE